MVSMVCLREKEFWFPWLALGNNGVKNKRAGESKNKTLLWQPLSWCVIV